MKKIKLLIILLSIYTQVSAQEQMDPTQQGMVNIIRQKMIDSITALRIDEAALMYPVIRQFSITQQNNFSGNIRSKLYDNRIYNGRISTARTTVDMKLPILSQNKNILVANLGFIYQGIGLDKFEKASPIFPLSVRDRNVSMFNFGLNYTRRDTLLNIPVSLTATVGGLFDAEFRSQQLSFGAVVTVPVITTESSRLTVGIIAIIDPSAMLPAIPFISYYHKFKAPDMDLMADMPYRIALRKAVTKRTSISIFGETSSNSSFLFFGKGNPDLPDRMTFATTEQKSGLLLECRVTKKVVFSLSGGLNTTIQSRIFEVGKRQGDYLITNKNGAMPFVQLGFSLLPFWSPFKK
jgi:hypothetical protein